MVGANEVVKCVNFLLDGVYRTIYGLGRTKSTFLSRNSTWLMLAETSYLEDGKKESYMGMLDLPKLYFVRASYCSARSPRKLS